MLGSILLIVIVELDLLMWKLPHTAKQGAQKGHRKTSHPKKRKRKHLFMLNPHVDSWLDR